MEDENMHESPDDALEETRAGGMFRPSLDEERQENDFGTPAEPISNKNVHHLEPDNPAFDTDIDPGELQMEGPGEASDVNHREELPTEKAFPLEPEDDQEV